MKKFALGFLLFYLFVGVLISRYELDIFSETIQNQNHDLFFDYRGVSHVASNKSVGSRTPLAVIQAANESNLKFLILTDLNYFEQNSSLNGYRNEVLVFTNQKISYLDKYYLVYHKSPSAPYSNMGHAHAAITDELGGKSAKSHMLVLAHPLKPDKKHYETKVSPGVDGIEVINLRKLWKQVWTKSKASFMWTVLVYPFNPHLALFRLLDFPEDEIKLWDKMQKTRKVIGFLGNETTSKLVKIARLKAPFPTYETSFNFASNHLLVRSELTGNTERDREKVFNAIKNGNFYMSLDTLADPKGFAAYIQQGKNIFLMGDEIRLKPKTEIVIDLPHLPSVPFEVVVYKNGEKIFWANEKSSRWEITEPGVYRAMVRVIPTLPLPDGKKWFPWIYTNSFYIK